MRIDQAINPSAKQLTGWVWVWVGLVDEPARQKSSEECSPVKVQGALQRQGWALTLLGMEALKLAQGSLACGRAGARAPGLGTWAFVPLRWKNQWMGDSGREVAGACWARWAGQQNSE